MDGVEMIKAERSKQFAKGYTAEHDDKHKNQGLASLASLLAYPPDEVSAEIPVPVWASKEFDRIDGEKVGRVRQLAIAGALIAAEIDRLLRAESQSAPRTV